METDDYLSLSKLNHFVYCKHRWALTELYQEWNDNEFITKGHLVHQKTNNPFLKEKRGDILITRSLHVASKTLKLFGLLDTVEFHKNNNGISLPTYEGKWQPVIVEFKQKEHSNNGNDITQVIAQALCLEEELNCHIDTVYLYYHKTNKKKKIDITNDKRNKTKKIIQELHHYFQTKQIDPPHYSKKCKGCTLYDICNPKWPTDVKTYIKEKLKTESSPLL